MNLIAKKHHVPKLWAIYRNGEVLAGENVGLTASAARHRALDLCAAKPTEHWQIGSYSEDVTYPPSNPINCSDVVVIHEPRMAR